MFIFFYILLIVFKIFEGILFDDFVELFVVFFSREIEVLNWDNDMFFIIILNNLLF